MAVIISSTLPLRDKLMISHSASVLLNLLNKLGNSDKMHGWLSILSLFRHEFNEFNILIHEHEC